MLAAQLRNAELQAYIHRLMDEGRLPVILPEKIAAGYGSGSNCRGCDQPVTPTQIEYDIEDHSNGSVRLTLHRGCYVLWQIECVRRIHKRDQGSLPIDAIPHAW